MQWPCSAYHQSTAPRSRLEALRSDFQVYSLDHAFENDNQFSMFSNHASSSFMQHYPNVLHSDFQQLDSPYAE